MGQSAEPSSGQQSRARPCRCHSFAAGVGTVWIVRVMDEEQRRVVGAPPGPGHVRVVQRHTNPGLETTVQTRANPAPEAVSSSEKIKIEREFAHGR